MSTATLEQPPTASTISIVGDDELYEIIDGQRVRTPPMAALAVWTAFELARHLGNFTVAGLGRAVTEMLFHLPAPINRDRRPDIAFVSYHRWPKNRPIPSSGNAWDVVPNLATEVVSPADSVEELEQKIAEYFRAGVQLVWVVHPTRSKIHVYQSPTQISRASAHSGQAGQTCALLERFIYRSSCGLLVRLTEDEQWRRLNMFFWTRSLVTLTNWRTHARRSIKNIRW